MEQYRIEGNIVDLFNRDIFKGVVVVSEGKIKEITKVNYPVPARYILPGFIDAHVHVESSMLTPSRFAEMVVSRGTIAAIADPHEIANVVGEKGVEFMINEGKKVPFKFFFGAPSCVPATSFETSGATINSDGIGRLLKSDDIWFLSEMMNFPGVISRDPEVMKKIAAAKEAKKPIDGHAPGVRGESLDKYVEAGISTDHECAFIEEAKEKILKGMKVLIREGSAARNFMALCHLFESFPTQLMLCTDDSHPDDILFHGHIDKIIKMGLNAGVDIFDLLSSASIIPVQHYNLPVGLLRVGDPADFIVVKNLQDFEIVETHINGQRVYSKLEGVQFTLPEVIAINNFNCNKVDPVELKVILPDGVGVVKVIEAIDGEIYTNEISWQPDISTSREVLPSTREDIIKLVVINRYSSSPPSIGFVKSMGLTRGAIGSTVAHDSHNIIVAGVDDVSIASAINTLIGSKGGIVACDGEGSLLLPLPVAGLMSTDRGVEVATLYKKLDERAKEMGSRLKAPFMTLSFLPLLVIPSLKLGDIGLFDVNRFNFVSLFDK